VHFLLKAPNLAER